jgi:hypothetical protein
VYVSWRETVKKRNNGMNQIKNFGLFLLSIKIHRHTTAKIIKPKNKRTITDFLPLLYCFHRNYP